MAINNYSVGVDIGSISTEVVVLNPAGEIHLSAVEQSGANGLAVANRIIDKFSTESGLKNLRDYPLVATGYGRNQVNFARKTVTEITCHAVGAKRIFPDTDTVLDIGGQDSKAIKVSDDGRIEDFQMNDRCAAGTGRFLEVMAGAMDLDLRKMNELYFLGGEPVNINATCTVFAESEIISLLNDGVSLPSLVKGIFASVAKRSLQLLRVIRPGKQLTLTGGVCKSKALVEEIKAVFPGEVFIPAEPQIVGALGAAIIAGKIKD